MNLFEEFEKLRFASSKEILKEAEELNIDVEKESDVEKELDAAFNASRNIIFTDASRAFGLVSRIKRWINRKGLGYCSISPSYDETDLGDSISSEAKEEIENELSRNGCKVLLVIELNRLTKAEKQAVLSIANSGKYFCIATVDGAAKEPGVARFKNVKA